MSFSGFTDDDIRKISHNQNVDKPIKESQNKSNQKRVNFKLPPKTNNKEKKIQLPHSITNTSDNIPKEAKLDTKPVETGNEIKILENDSCSVDIETSKSVEENPIAPQILEKRCIDLEEFEARQKLIEEQNRKRKELLAKALADRTKRTQEEAQRLQEIQDEFKKLDALLSNDVKILRKQIEIASFEYMECQKKYNKIEKEFLDAKFLLHQKIERKELLTEHLCAIIEKNEERKAEKLTELLKKLEVSSVDDQNQENGVN